MTGVSRFAEAGVDLYVVSPRLSGNDGRGSDRDGTDTDPADAGVLDHAVSLPASDESTGSTSLTSSTAVASAVESSATVGTDDAPKRELTAPLRDRRKQEIEDAGHAGNCQRYCR